MKKLTNFTAALSLAIVGMLPQSAEAVLGTAAATANVIAAISIAQVADLDFGTVAQGDGAATIAPAAGANFTVSGAPSTAYTISFPQASVTMANGACGANCEILVNNFVSLPAVGANGNLSAGGTETLRVGADRAAILATQVTGAYTVNFDVDVVY